MLKNLSAVLAVVLVVLACGKLPTEAIGPSSTPRALAKPASGGGFDQYGYNYGAGIFVGPADGVDRVLDGTVWGDPTYAKDRLVLKWSPAWDEARFNGAPWTPDAWTDNEWNGKVPGGSGEVWHYKIVWVGPLLENGPYWRDGGYAIWGEFEVILSQGSAGGEHIWDVHANPNGYGLSTR